MKHHMQLFQNTDFTKLDEEINKWHDSNQNKNVVIVSTTMTSTLTQGPNGIWHIYTITYYELSLPIKPAQ